MIRDLEIDLLRAFVAVASHRNFTHAGAALGRTQSAVSMQVKRLEEIVARKLFERTKKTVEITSDGETLLSYANRILRINDEALSNLLEPEAQGLVRIGAPDDYMTCLLPEFLMSFSKAHPRIRMEVSCDNGIDLLEELARGKLDLVLATHTLDTISGEVIRREPLHWVAGPDYHPDPSDDLPLLLFPQGCVCRDLALRALDTIDRSWRIAYTSRNLAVLQNAIASDAGVGAMEASIIPDGFKVLDGQPGFPKLPDVVIALHRNPDDQMPAIDLVGSHLLRELKRAS